MGPPLSGPAGGWGRAEQGCADLHIVDAFGLCVHHEEAVIEVLFGPPPAGQGLRSSEPHPPSRPVWLPQTYWVGRTLPPCRGPPLECGGTAANRMGSQHRCAGCWGCGKEEC